MNRVLHSDFSSAAETTLDGLIQSYPEAGEVRFELYEPEPGDYSLGNSDTKGVIKLNAYWFAEPKAKFEEAVVAGRANQRHGLPKWHGGIGDIDHEFDRLLTHEFSHHLMVAIGEAANKFAKAGCDATIVEPALAVSGYATVDSTEWWADTFAAMRMGGAGSPQIAEMLAFLEDTLDIRADAAQYPIKLEIELSNWDSLRELLEFLKYVRSVPGGGHSFMIAADESAEGPGRKEFGKQMAGAVCFVDGDGNDHIGRIWVNGEEVK